MARTARSGGIISSQGTVMSENGHPRCCGQTVLNISSLISTTVTWLEAPPIGQSLSKQGLPKHLRFSSRSIMTWIQSTPLSLRENSTLRLTLSVVQCVHKQLKSCLKQEQTLCCPSPVSYTHLRAHETDSYLVCRLLLEKKK